MSRMYDRILESGYDVAPCLRGQRQWLQWDLAIKDQVNAVLTWLREKRPIVLVADNIAQYFYAGTDQERWDMTKDFPCLAPPWQICWVEFKMPSEMVSCETGTTRIDRSTMGTNRALLVHSMKAEEYRQWAEKVAAFNQGHWTSRLKADGKLADPLPESHWIQIASAFIELAKGDIFDAGIAIWQLRKDGTVIDPGKGGWQHLFMGLAPAEEILGPEQAATMTEIIKDGFLWPCIYVAALAYSFINCRNTVIVDHSPDPKLAKANLKRGKPPSITYKTLEIEAVKKILSTKGNIAVNGLQRALHICRGHFKDYREHGLFGKVKGLYWWDMHIRGTDKAGVVDKDYATPKH